MFTVGEFSRLGQVSKRLLRYYDEIGLLKPMHTDAQTGYRYYSAEQMATLNRILALKELGLTLEQIRGLLSDHVSTDEMQGMLLLKKAEIEQQVAAELRRIRSIESRLQAIHDAEANRPLNVIIKQIPAQGALSLRRQMETTDHVMALFAHIDAALPDRAPYGLSFLMCHDEELSDCDMDLELGRLVETSAHAPVPLHDAMQLRYRVLPPVEMMATTVIQGPCEVIHRGYGEIGRWAEANGYRLAGHPRELTLQPAWAGNAANLITEIQFPVASCTSDV